MHIPGKPLIMCMKHFCFWLSAEIVLFDWVIFSLQMRGAYYNTRHTLSETDMSQVAKYNVKCIGMN